MGTFFEEELKKVCRRVGCLKNQKYISNKCFGEIGKVLRVRIMFNERDLSSYTSMIVRVINRTKGVVDDICLDFASILGSRQVENPNFENGIVPHIRIDAYKVPKAPEWFVYEPVDSDYEALAKAVTDYLSVFADDDYKEEA